MMLTGYSQTLLCEVPGDPQKPSVMRNCDYTEFLNKYYCVIKKNIEFL
jgi:hypothetical protein